MLVKSRWILPILLWVVLSFFSYEFLLKVEERSYFAFDLFWLRDFLNKPSGILSYFGLLFTQFLHIPWLGSMIWVLMLTASSELTRIIFKIPSNLSAFTYIPAFVFVSYNMSMGYMIYLVNLPGYFFMPVLGYLWALLTISALRKSKKPAISLIMFLVWGFAGYYIAGFYALVGIVAAAIDVIFSGQNRIYRIISLVGAVSVVVLAPILFFGTTTYNLPSGWTIGLPNHIHSVSLSRMQIPLIVALLFLPLASLVRVSEASSNKNYFVILQGITIVAILVLSPFLWFRDSNFKTELKMIRAIDNLEWETVTKTFDRYSDKHEKDPSWQPTRVMVLLKDLALIKTGKEGERAFSFDDGSLPQKRKWDVPMSMQIGWTLGLHYGIPGLCQRWCFEETTIIGWNNIALKYYTMTAILFDNTNLAEKYLEKLNHTLFYRKWAKEQHKICRNRNLITQTAPYDLILPLLCHNDRITSDMEGCEMFLKRHFNGPSPQNSTPLYDRVALLFAMKSKDATLFWTRFLIYLDSTSPQEIDRFYQEAAYLYSNIDNNNLLKVLPFDEETKKLYKSFVSIANKVGPVSMEEAHNHFPRNLRHTYYFYYYYVNKLQSF